MTSSYGSVHCLSQHVCILACMSVCVINVCLFVCMRVVVLCVCVCVYTCVWLCVCVCIHMRVVMCVCGECSCRRQVCRPKTR